MSLKPAVQGIGAALRGGEGYGEQSPMARLAVRMCYRGVVTLGSLSGACVSPAPHIMP